MAFVAGACSIVNAPDDVNPGTGGAGGGGSTATQSTGSQGGGGGEIGCETNADCTTLTTECATGECGPNGVCVAAPQPAATACGAAPAGSCDLADACDGNGNCVNGFVPNGTYCDDCPAGAGSCALCNDGVCADCTTRAELKTFRTPIAASGWELTGGWGIYPETPPRLSFGPIPALCDDGLDNDSDGLIDAQDPGCAGTEDNNEGQPASCNDALDNDSDGLIDLNDPGCSAAGDDTEWNDGPTVFPTPVLGTDGNRKHPYGYNGATEFESSTATSPPTVLPSTLRFRSWHWDEGYNYDLKAVQVSLNGVSFTNVHICVLNDPNAEAFCLPSSFQGDRDPNQWDMIELPLPGGMAGQVGYVRFVYDTTDSCCDWERGWYVDALNFGQDCACGDDAGCAYATNECGMGSCDGDECAIAPTNQGASCTGAGSSECSMPTCDANGWCAEGSLPFELDTCDSCGDADAACSVCIDATCLTCPNPQTIDFLDTTNWAFTGDWSFASCVRANSVTPSTAPCFPAPVAMQGEPNTTPVLGTDGSRTSANPWTGAASEVEAGTLVTDRTIIPANLTFKSWHQDRGGNDTFTPRDTKTIRVSTDGGNNWAVILDCNGNNTTPFCIPSTPNQNRPLSDWDDVSIPIPSNLVGEEGIFEFAYNTVDAGQGWERGWYIDDLNINRCDCWNQTCLP